MFAHNLLHKSDTVRVFSKWLTRVQCSTGLILPSLWCMIRVTHQGTALGMKLLSTVALLFSGSYKKTTPGVVVQGLPEFTETVCV